MDLTVLEKLLEREEQPSYRFTQAKRAFFVELASGWEALTVFPQSLRQRCVKDVPWDVLEEEQHIQSLDGQTEKWLFRCKDGVRIETVLMRHADGRHSVCVSSQAGCAMACGFCATGAQGFTRNLTATEIAEQVVRIARFLSTEKVRVSHVVVMGMGEPLHNTDAVLEAVHLWNDTDGLAIAARHITISTCGIVPGILRLAQEPIQANLAISLHAPNNDLRSYLMPVNRVYPLDALMRAVETYMQATNRRVTFEYVLLKDVNDAPEQAEALAAFLKPYRRLVHVNLIKYHKTGPFIASDRETRERFFSVLQRHAITVTHRVTFGEMIDAACGQLTRPRKDV